MVSLIIAAYISTHGGGALRKSLPLSPRFVARSAIGNTTRRRGHCRCRRRAALVQARDARRRPQSDAEDVYSTLKFAAITVLVLPSLPDRAFGPPPFDRLQPLDLADGRLHFCHQLYGLCADEFGQCSQRHRPDRTVGDSVSSTAVTFSFGRSSEQESETYRPVTAVANCAIGFQRLYTSGILIQIGRSRSVAPPASSGYPLFNAAILLAGYAPPSFVYVTKMTRGQRDQHLSTPLS